MWDVGGEVVLIDCGGMCLFWWLRWVVMIGVFIFMVWCRKCKWFKIGVCIIGVFGGLNFVEFCGGLDFELLVNWLFWFEGIIMLGLGLCF